MAALKLTTDIDEEVIGDPIDETLPVEFNNLVAQPLIPSLKVVFIISHILSNRNNIPSSLLLHFVHKISINTLQY